MTTKPVKKEFDIPKVWQKIDRPTRGEFYVPDKLEPMVPIKSRRTRAGYTSPEVTGQDGYESTGYVFDAYSYLATGRFFSTQTTPSEYGDGDVFDALLVIIHTAGMPPEACNLLQPSAVVRLTRKQYTGEGALYRLVTGNVYPEHVEYKLVALVD